MTPVERFISTRPVTCCVIAFIVFLGPILAFAPNGGLM